MKDNHPHDHHCQAMDRMTETGMFIYQSQMLPKRYVIRGLEANHTIDYCPWCGADLRPEEDRRER